MSFRLQWAFCACVIAGFAGTAFAQIEPVALPVNPGPPPVAVQTSNTLIDADGRLQWLLVENLGAGSVLDDFAVGAVDTFFDTPKEYDTHWSGFAERSAMVAANYSVKSVMEAGIGSIWGEDPRYVRTSGRSLKSRMGYVIRMTFLARNRAGNTMPAYSRFIAFPASSFLSNAWQPTSQASVNDAVVRVGLGFLSRMGENAWKEFIARRR